MESGIKHQQTNDQLKINLKVRFKCGIRQVNFYLFFNAEEKKEPEEEWHPYIPDKPSPILTGFYNEEGKFWLSMVIINQL